jgi:hypothetical protein
VPPESNINNLFPIFVNRSGFSRFSVHSNIFRVGRIGIFFLFSHYITGSFQLVLSCIELTEIKRLCFIWLITGIVFVRGILHMLSAAYIVLNKVEMDVKYLFGVHQEMKKVMPGK